MQQNPNTIFLIIITVLLALGVGFYIGQSTMHHSMMGGMDMNMGEGMKMMHMHDDGSAHDHSAAGSGATPVGDAMQAMGHQM